MKFEYTISEDAGRKAVITATSRQKAIELYLKATGMPEDFFKQHCKIKNEGRFE